MAQLCGACCGLVVFSAMILRGMAVGNPAQIVILRALIGLVVALVLGNVVGWIGQILVSDNLPETPTSEATLDTDPSSSPIKTVS